MRCACWRPSGEAGTKLYCLVTEARVWTTCLRSLPGSVLVQRRTCAREWPQDYKSGTLPLDYRATHMAYFTLSYLCGGRAVRSALRRPYQFGRMSIRYGTVRHSDQPLSHRQMWSWSQSALKPYINQYIAPMMLLCLVVCFQLTLHLYFAIFLGSMKHFAAPPRRHGGTPRWGRRIGDA